MIRCGCFFGTVDEFNNRVIEKNADPFYIDFVELAVKKINALNQD